MRNFDEELIQDREFRIGGQIFQWRYPHWEVGAELFDDELKPEAEEGAETNGAFSFKADTELAIKNIPQFLEPEAEAHKRWRELAARKTDPIPRHQIIQLYRWLVQVTSGLPTTPPSDSEPGGGDSDSSSEVASS
jgi:hypothetical protein